MPTPSRRDDGKDSDGFLGCFGAWFLFCALLAVGVLGVVVWAVITLVNHFTA
ncbi:hypothetical protein ABZW49_10785 [Nonomuraea wenchangensis]